MAPNGNGGVYMSLRDEGILSMLQKEGVQSIFQFGVDNILCHVADPTFLGFCASKERRLRVENSAEGPRARAGGRDCSCGWQARSRRIL